MRSIADEHVLIGRDLAGDDLQLVLRRNLPQKILNSGRHLPGQHPFAVFRAPHNMNLEVVFRVAAQSISSHKRLHLPFAYPFIGFPRACKSD